MNQLMLWVLEDAIGLISLALAVLDYTGWSDRVEAWIDKRRGRLAAWILMQDEFNALLHERTLSQLELQRRVDQRSIPMMDSQTRLPPMGTYSRVAYPTAAAIERVLLALPALVATWHVGQWAGLPLFPFSLVLVFLVALVAWIELFAAILALIDRSPKGTVGTLSLMIAALDFFIF